MKKGKLTKIGVIHLANQMRNEAYNLMSFEKAFLVKDRYQQAKRVMDNASKQLSCGLEHHNIPDETFNHLAYCESLLRKALRAVRLTYSV